MQVRSDSIPACDSYQHNNEDCQKSTAAARLDDPDLILSQSIPACNSHQHNEKNCERDTAAAPVDLPLDLPYMAQQNSIPACNSHQHNEKNCERESAAVPLDDWDLKLAQSIPACNSYYYHGKGCKVETAAVPLDLVQQESIPACNSHQYHGKGCKVNTAAAPLMQVSSSSIPACNSHQYNEKECEVESAAAPLSRQTLNPLNNVTYAQENSIPACNSHQYNEKNCERESAAVPLDDWDLKLAQQESIPACNSYYYHGKGCKTNTAAVPLDLAQEESIPACNSHQYHGKGCKVNTAAAPLMQVRSVPACTSFECKKRDQSQIIDETYRLAQSDPICHSAGCPDKQRAHLPKDYRVPNFGLDHDIIVSQANEKASQAKLAHTWNWSSDPTPEEIADKALIRGSSQMQKGQASDPICSSAQECFKNWKKSSDDEAVHYNVDHGYPLDGDIIVSQRNLKEQEGIQKHELKVPSFKK